MPSELWFVVPAYRRFELTSICLRQLARTCDELAGHDVKATAVVVADDENLETARELGFWAVERENEPLGRKFNDGIELAYSEGAEYVTMLGSDNWVDAELVAAQIPGPGLVGCHRLCGIVHESGSHLAHLRISYEGGDGIRTFPTELFAATKGRPAAEHARRAVDTSIVEGLRRSSGWKPGYVYTDLHQLQVVGFQSYSHQLNGYAELVRAFGVEERANPWAALQPHYPLEAVEEIMDHYESRKSVAV